LRPAQRQFHGRASTTGCSLRSVSTSPKLGDLALRLPVELKTGQRMT
jgi:hypothetical protein